MYYACKFDIPGFERAHIHGKESDIDIFVNNICVTNMLPAVIEVMNKRPRL